MHELSLMQGVVNLLRKSASENNVKRITKVLLVVGEMTMAVPDALQFAFESFKEEELFRDAVLEIRMEPVRGECRDCHRSFDIKDFVFLCPFCSGPNVKVASGRDLYIDYYEGD
ncbi:hydrogenase nickel incorporation protein HypA [Thermacetogenium phaeum DSM 12270]|jgi:hydrogenase nickel incorporation protein HypA/HybF|uniref:Hydrogenase maturation factor HypA n=2 Tax=Thermacetogenium phaeum TaxID=85874 RepID=K4LY44_THEPS|nr:hydrogenase maturation nickel metallochaperone HypA [Thermacetogenium phaeum]MDK2880944.1 hydrogenase nickel incorporation protein HypA/HybF [Clostridia bacterium]MDN5366216.1 hydrogenase nickel incorporation protein HypA/HybF [Thermacetogenium sp.]AFV12854.1 hydrogenase nickel incorporation protein HypA [Thermacetogenium phaeum DSM 12270]KUK37002.1 MAG: Hydrogenase nickel incorporation protein HypA [Thermacetogenium phaeum]MDN5376011.1 hydrogenase nickel incorporation protein HypA/HybF [Th